MFKIWMIILFLMGSGNATESLDNHVQGSVVAKRLSTTPTPAPSPPTPTTWSDLEAALSYVSPQVATLGTTFSSCPPDQISLIVANLKLIETVGLGNATAITPLVRQTIFKEQLEFIARNWVSGSSGTGSSYYTPPATIMGAPFWLFWVYNDPNGSPQMTTTISRYPIVYNFLLARSQLTDSPHSNTSIWQSIFGCCS